MMCRPNMERHGKYIYSPYLGSGCLRAMNTETGEEVAVKRLPRDSLTSDLEADILQHTALLHPHVVQFKELSLSDANLLIATEYVSGGSMFSYVRSGQFRWHKDEAGGK